MFGDICSSVVHSLADSPFSLISPLTLSNHLILGIPLFRTFPSSFSLRSALLFSPYARTSSTSYIGLPLRFLPLSVPRYIILSFLTMSTFVTSIPISNVAIYFIVPSACPCLDLTSVRQLPLGSSRSFSVTQLSTDSLPVLPTVLHAEGDFGIHAVLHLPLTSIPDNYLNVFTLFTVSFYKWICPRKIQLPPTDPATYQSVL